jgi:hypothetical protein
MAVVAYASGTQTASVGTEHFLSSPNEAGTYTLHVDTVNMANGDVLELRIYQMILSGGVARVAYYGRFEGAQPTDDLIKISVPISNDLAETNALRFSLRQPSGTGRNYPWKVLRYT